MDGALTRRGLLGVCGALLGGGLVARTGHGQAPATVSGPTVWTDWRVPGGLPYNDGRPPSDDQALSAEPAQAWTQSIEDRSPIGFIAVRGTLIVAFDTQVTAYAEATGKQRWTAQPDGLTVTGAPIWTGTVVLPTADGLLAIDPVTGDQRWQQAPIDGAVQAVAPVGETLVASWETGQLTIHEQDGSHQTTIDLPGTPVGQLAGSSTTAFVVTDEGQLVELQDGDVRQSIDLNAEPVAGPVFSPGPILVPTFQEGVIAVRDGTRQFQVLADERQATRPAVYETHGVTTTFDGTVERFSLAGGTQSWRRSVSTGVAPPVVDQNGVYVPSTRSVGAYDRSTGTQQWTLELDARPQQLAVGVESLAVLTSDQLRYYQAPASAGHRATVYEFLRALPTASGDLGDLAQQAHDLFLNREFEAAATTAAEGQRLVEQQAAARTEAIDAIEQLRAAIDRANLSGTTANQRLVEAETALENGNIEQALQHAQAGQQAIEAIQQRRQDARQAIDELQTALATTPERIPTADLSDRLADSRASFAAGDYETAHRRAQTALDTLQTRRTAEQEAADRIAAVEETLAGPSRLVPPTATMRASDTLQAASNAYDDGEFVIAREQATQAREQLLLDTAVVAVGALTVAGGSYAVAPDAFPWR